MRQLGRVVKVACHSNGPGATSVATADIHSSASEPRAGTEQLYEDMDRMAEGVQTMIERQLYLVAWFAKGRDGTFFWFFFFFWGGGGGGGGETVIKTSVE